jgi:NitT/TauT family transport system permease protein
VRTPLIRWAGLAGLAGVLEALVAGGLVSPWVLARPSEMARAFPALWRDEALPRMVLVTFGETLAAITLAGALGIAAGYLLFACRSLGRAYEPWLGALFAAPTVLLYPLFLVVLGRSLATIVAMGVVTGAIPVTIKMREGLLGVPRVLLDVGRSFKLTEAALVRKILVPAAAPTIFTGFRLGLIYALVNVVGVEFLIDLGGLGRLVSDLYYRYQIPAMYAVILCIVGVSLVVFRGLGALEARIRTT